jgi:integrase
VGITDGWEVSMGKLTAIQVARAATPGMYSDGQGLYLQVTHAGAKSWIYRYQLHGKQHYLGLGSASAITLKRARELLAEPRRLRAEGIDPVETRRAQRSAARLAAAKGVTFRQCAESYFATHEHAWKSEVHRQQWRTSVQTDAYPALGSLSVQDIDTSLVLEVLRPIWKAKPVSANRLRSRIENILDAAKSADLRTGDNPARWAGHLENLLPSPRKMRSVEHYAALPYRDIPGFMIALRTRDGLSARALELAVLTATRASEVVGARWNEVDFDQRTWTISAARMKAGKEHKIPLSACAAELLRDLHAVRSGDFVFPGRSGKGISTAAMLKTLAAMGRSDLTVHGFRSTFRDWAAERTAFPNEVVEMALAHAIKGAVEAAYRRGDLFEKRARVMTAWSEFCAQALTSDVVVPIRK